MSDIVERLRGQVTAIQDRNTDDASLARQFYIANRALKAEAADEIERLRSLLKEADGYATRLAVALHGKHYAENTSWRPLEGDLIGVLTQIDNMTSGLSRKNSRMFSDGTQVKNVQDESDMFDE